MNAYIERREVATINFERRKGVVSPYSVVKLGKIMKLLGMPIKLKPGDTGKRWGLTLRRVQLALEERAAGREFSGQEERADREIRSLIRQDEKRSGR